MRKVPLTLVGMRRTCVQPSLSRTYSSKTQFNRPSPPPLPPEQQHEFEELLRAAQAPLTKPLRGGPAATTEADLSLHPDARRPVEPEFSGVVNPSTGEMGGPKREPVGKWGDEGDWSFKGRVSDF